MKRIFAVLTLAMALLLCAACGQKQPVGADVPPSAAGPVDPTPISPGDPSPTDPVTPDPGPVEPAPVPPEPGEPEGNLPQEAVPLGLSQEDKAALWRGGVWLNDHTLALLLENENGLLLRICTAPEGTLLQEIALPGYEGSLMGLELPEEGPWRLAYYNGNAVRQLVLDETWQITESAYEEEEVFRMGEHTLSVSYPDILLDGEIILDGSWTAEPYSEYHGEAYALTAILDEHRFLFGSFNTYYPNYYSIYDIDTGEQTMLCPYGTYLCGQWGDFCIRASGSDIDGSSYDFQRVALTDLSAVPLARTHSTQETAVQKVEFNQTGSRMVLVSESYAFEEQMASQTAEIYDTATGALLYAWTWSDVKEGSLDYYSFYPIGEKTLLLELPGAEGADYWMVNY